MKNEENEFFEDGSFFNKKTEHKLCFKKTELTKIIESKNFNPEDLISLLEKQYPNVYNQDAGVWEGYSLKRHTLMVIRQFEKYFSHSDLPLGVSVSFFRLILALHDIGKPEAIAKGGKHLQHKYTQKYILSLFKLLEIEEKNTNIALVLASGDPIGKYISNEKSIFDTLETVEKMAKKADVPIDQFFKLLCIYYKVDAGSYTKNAGGIESLDRLFNFDEIGKKLNFADNIQKKIDQLFLKVMKKI